MYHSIFDAGGCSRIAGAIRKLRVRLARYRAYFPNGVPDCAITTVLPLAL
jgi:hypothetical protein